MPRGPARSGLRKSAGWTRPDGRLGCAAVLGRFSPRTRWIVGTGALLLAAWVCMYGKLWCFEKFAAHRFTARAILTGTLRLRSVVALTGHDEQVFNGGVYTNWGFGVPLLQLPFHAFAGATGLLHGFFPDRAIYFVYLACAMPVLWAALDKLLAMRAEGPLATPAPRRHLVSWAATWLVLQVTVFPFMETRFVVYEETLAYMSIAELMALSAYVFALARPTSWLPVVAMGVCAGVGLLVRPTALLYVGVWGALVFLQHEGAAAVKRAAAYAAVLAPFGAFWLWSNWVRSGSVIGLGYANSNPAWLYEMPLLRFGGTCGESPWQAAMASARLFGAFFFYIWRTPSAAFLRDCHFDFEERDGTREPYFGPWVLVLLVGMLVGLARRRDRRLALLVPYAGFAALFAMFVWRSEGFAWRYVGDFWPIIVLACVQYVATQPATALRPFDARLARIMFVAGSVALARYLVPWEWSSGGPHGDGRADLVSVRENDAMWAEFRASRWGREPPMPSRIACGDRLDVPYDNGLGWKAGCKVESFTNVYLGVDDKPGEDYVLRFTTRGLDARDVRVYVNGAIYEAHRVGDAYEARVIIRRSELHSPVVVATIQWARSGPAPSGELVSVELS